MAKMYTHGGKLGDIVYSMPAFRASGCDRFVLIPRGERRASWFDPGVVLPLLLSQGIRAGVLRGGGVVQAGAAWVHGDVWRAGRRWPGENIAERHCMALGLPVAGARAPWLRVEPLRVAEVVVFRSARYRPLRAQVDWRGVVGGARGSVVFLGSALEHVEFCREFGVDVRFWPTRDLLEAARVIAGADRVVGNQTALMALANGLGASRVIERCESIDDCIFRF